MFGGCIQSFRAECRGCRALCVSLRGTELKRCAPSEADEERASPERNMWMPGRQRNIAPCLCALVRRHASNCVYRRSVRRKFLGSVLPSWVGVELASAICFTYRAFSNGLPRDSAYYMNENLLQLAHSSLEPLIVTLYRNWRGS